MIKIPFLIFSGCVHKCDGLFVSDIFYGVKYLRLLWAYHELAKGSALGWLESSVGRALHWFRKYFFFGVPFSSEFVFLGLGLELRSHQTEGTVDTSMLFRFSKLIRRDVSRVIGALSNAECGKLS